MRKEPLQWRLQRSPAPDRTSERGTVMETIKTKSVIGEDQHLRIDMEVPLPPGPIEVVVVISRETGRPPADRDLETVRQQFLASAGCGEFGDPLSSRRVDEVLYRKKQ